MTLEQVKAACERRKVALPADMASNAQAGTLREGLLERYLALHASGAFGRWCAGIGPLRDRLIADQRFLFKVRARAEPRDAGDARGGFGSAGTSAAVACARAASVTADADTDVCALCACAGGLRGAHRQRLRDGGGGAEARGALLEGV